jgi:hypothetical protein
MRKPAFLRVYTLLENHPYLVDIWIVILGVRHHRGGKNNEEKENSWREVSDRGHELPLRVPVVVTFEPCLFNSMPVQFTLSLLTSQHRSSLLNKLVF